MRTSFPRSSAVAILAVMQMALALAGCYTYDEFQGRAINQTSEAHSYNITVEKTKNGDILDSETFTLLLQPNSRAQIDSWRSSAGGFTIHVQIDGNQTAFGQTGFTRDEGPGGFSVITSHDGTRVEFWFH